MRAYMSAALQVYDRGLCPIRPEVLRPYVILIFYRPYALNEVRALIYV